MKATNEQQRIQFEQAKEGVSALNRLLPRLNLLADETLADRVDEIQERLMRPKKRRDLAAIWQTS